MSLRRSTSPPTRRGLNLVLNRSRSSVDAWAANASSPTRSPKPLLPFCTSPSHLEDITLELDPSETTSPYSDTLQSPAMPAGSRSMCGRTAKEYEEQVRVLKKENFNLKLRIYFLEERMSSVGRQGANSDDAENKLIELKVELESMKRDMKNKQLLLAQAGKAIELMEEQHAQELNKLKQELQEFEVQNRASKTASSLPSHLQQRNIPLDNSMQLYADAFSLRTSILMPPPPAPGSMIDGQGDARLRGQESATETTLESLEQQQQIAELMQQLQQCMAELEACRERERNLSEALDSKEPDIQIKIQELNQKDAMLEEQRKIIVEIEIKLEEKQKQLESLRQQLEATQATVARHEAEQAALSEHLRQSEEKRNKACKIVQSLMTSNHQMTNQLREAKERSSKAEWEARQNPPDDLGEMASDETERLWTELEQQRKQVERFSKENTALLKEKAATEQALRQELADARLMLDRAGRLSCGTNIAGADIVDSTAKLMFGRLDELAAFLAALLQRPHLLTGLSPAHRASLLHAVQKSWGTARQRYSLSLSLTMQQPDESVASDLDMMCEDASLVGQIQEFLKGSEQEELMSEVEAARERTVEMWPVSVSSDLVAGKEMELINWETPRHEEEEDEGEDGGGATAVEREPPGSHNQSESEVWSEPDRSVSQARIGLPESCTPVAAPERTALVSPASSEADLITRTPGKKASVKRLANRLRDSEQINEALRAELGVYQAMVKHSSPVSIHNSSEFGFPASIVLQEMETQRSRLESLLKQNDTIRQQLEHARISTSSKGDDLVRLREVQLNLEASRAKVVQLEAELASTTEHCQSLEAQLLEKEKGHIQALSQVQETLESLHARELKLQQEVEEARAKCLDLEQQAQSSSEQCQQLEEAAIRDCELRKQLVQQLQQVKCERDQLQSHLEDMASQKPVLTDCSVQTTEKEHLSFANSTGPSSLIHLSDCDDVFQTDSSHIAEQMAGAVAQRNVDADTHRHTLSSPDLGIESDTGRMSSMEVPPSPPAADPHSENWRLKQQLAKSHQLMESCLAALCRRNKDRRQVESSMKQQLKRTEEVLALAKANLRSLGPQCSSPSIELPSPVQH